MAESIGVSLLESGLWMIPLAILMVLGGLAFWIRTTERGIHLRVKPLLPRINTAGSTLRELQTLAMRYTSLDREPFRSQGAELASLLARSDEHTARLKQTYVHLQDWLRIRHYSWWQLILGSVFLWGEWQHMSSETRQLEESVSELEELVAAARQRVQGMQHAGDELAQRVQNVMAQAAETGRLLDELIDHQLSGPPFEEMVSKEEALAERLAEIPEVFLRSDDDARLRQSDTATIADAYAILSEVQPELEIIDRKLKALAQEHQAARQAAAGAQARLDVCQQQLAALPAALTAARLAGRLKELESRSAALLRELGAPDIARLKPLEQDAAALSRAVEQVAAELRQGRRQYLNLTALLEEAITMQEALIDAFTRAAKHPRLPLQWEGGRERLVGLNRQMSSLGQPEQARDIDQVAAQLEQLKLLRHEQGELDSWCRVVLDKQQKLAGLLDSPQAVQAMAALQAGQAIAAQVNAYSAQNWPRQEQVEALPADLNAQESRLRNLLPAGAVHPVFESDLEDYLLSVEEALEKQQLLVERLARVEQRLAELHQIEQAAKEHLQALRTVISQLLGLTAGNELLAELSRAKLETMRREAEQVSQSLEKRGQGSVDKKAGEVEHLVQDLERDAAAWLNRINQDIEKMKTTLAEKVSRLQEIAKLDDIEVERASSILKQDIQAAVAARGRQEVRLSLPEIIPQLKPRNDLWQDSRIALAKLSERVEKPLVESFQHAGEQRRHAQELLANMRNLTSGRRSWPPITVSLDELLPEGERLEARWSEIRSQTVQAIWAVRRYGELAVAYRTLAERLSQIERQAELDRTRIQAYEAELSALLRKWELQEQALYRDAAAVGRLRQLRSSSERRIQEVKRRWERESPTTPAGLTYPQIQKFYEDLIAELKRTRLLTGDETDGWREIDIDGTTFPVAVPDRESRSS